MKRFLSVFAAILLVFTGLAGCKAPVKDDGAIKIVTTIFPEYDFVRNILGDNPGGVELSLIIDNGVDMHSFQPTVSQIASISESDIFIYVGGESDTWVNDALTAAQTDSVYKISLMEVLEGSVMEEELSEGMQPADEEDEEEAEGPEYDEHVWLSLRNAITVCGAIKDALCEKDPANAASYQSNYEAYTARLTDLDAQYSSVVAESGIHTLLFADRFPFRYLVEDYGLDYYAAFAGCSAETEASFETVMFLAAKADELGLPCVLTIDGGDRRLADTVISNTARGDLPVLTLDSMQSVTRDEIEAGATYTGIMESNLTVLRQALSPDAVI